jgi:hypothetical protein
MNFKYAVAIACLLVACSRDGYKVLSYSGHANVVSYESATDTEKDSLKFVLVHDGQKIVASCWLGGVAEPDSNCNALKGMVGKTVHMEHVLQSNDILQYCPHECKDGQPSNMLRVVSISQQ